MVVLVAEILTILKNVKEVQFTTKCATASLQLHFGRNAHSALRHLTIQTTQAIAAATALHQWFKNVQLGSSNARKRCLEAKRYHWYTAGTTNSNRV